MEIPFVIRNIDESDHLILDIGCCESVLPLELAHLGHRVWAIDERSYPLSHPNLNFIQGDICDSNFNSSFFDVVISLSTLEHVGLGYYGDRYRERGDLAAMKELRRVLKPGGKLLLTAPYGRPGKTWQRIYDSVEIETLLAGFRADRIRYFVKSAETWAEAGEKEAASVDSPTDTRAVILIVARKCADTA